MKIKAFLLQETDLAIRLSNRRHAENSPAPVEVWVPRSIVPSLRKFGLRVGEEGLPKMVHAEIPSWYVSKTPDLEAFEEV